MGWFAWGLLAGWATASVAAAVIARVAYTRYARLRDRAREAERLAELGTLTGGLAHEIKNPLSTVHLNLQLAQEDLSPDQPGHARLANRLNVAQRETRRLRDTLDDFLRYAGKLELDRRPVELNRLLDELVDFFTPQAQVQRVQLRLKRAPQEVYALADENLIKQAVLNLMLNALQAMPAGGDLILSATATDHEAAIDVIDTGTGITPEAAGRIFDAYYSTKLGGTGLGLAMTRRIIREHGGRVSVRSEVGKGSDFALHLPLARGPAAAGAPAVGGDVVAPDRAVRHPAP